MPDRAPRRLRLLWAAFALVPAIGSAATTARGVQSSATGFSKIESLDVVADRAKLHLLLAGKQVGGGDAVVAYLSSDDRGATWTRPVRLDRAGDAPVISKRGNDVQIAVRGKTAVAVWQAQGEFPGSGPMVVAFSVDGGRHWRRGSNPASGDGTHNQSYMDVATDADGRVHLVWLDDREEHGNTQGLRYARSNDLGRHWQPETTIDHKVCTCCWTRLAMLGKGNPGVLYRDDSPHDMRLASHGHGDWSDRSAVGGFGWHFTGCPHCGGGLTADTAANRRLLYGVVWTGKENVAGLYFLASRDLGKTWTQPFAISDGHGREADIAAAANRLAIVFSHETDDGMAVELRESRDRGATWSPPRVLSSADAEADHPRIVATGDDLRAFWTEKTADGGRIWATSLID